MSVYKAVFNLTFVCMLIGCALADPDRSVSANRAAAQTSLDATYLIDGEEYALRNGQVTVEIVPGAASKTVVQIFGEPASGDLNNDGLADTALLLVQTTGGSGTFYYIAAALNRNGALVGTEAVFIGDRIAPQHLLVRYGVVIVDYTGRHPDEAMTVPPSLEKSIYLVLRDEHLEEIPLTDGEMIAAGEVVIGHEVRSFTPCGSAEASWLVGDSAALPAMQVAYHRVMSDSSPYTPLFMVLTGRPSGPPAEGFGAGYPSGFRASQLIHALSDAACANLNRTSE